MQLIFDRICCDVWLTCARARRLWSRLDCKFFFLLRRDKTQRRCVVSLSTAPCLTARDHLSHKVCDWKSCYGLPTHTRPSLSVSSTKMMLQVSIVDAIVRLGYKQTHAAYLWSLPSVGDRAQRATPLPVEALPTTIPTMKVRSTQAAIAATEWSCEIVPA